MIILHSKTDLNHANYNLNKIYSEFQKSWIYRKFVKTNKIKNWRSDDIYSLNINSDKHVFVAYEVSI